MSEITCSDGHAPIKYNVISVEPGAVNILQSSCPLCYVFKNHTNFFEGTCQDCEDSDVTRLTKGVKPDSDCSNCGEPGSMIWDLA